MAQRWVVGGKECPWGCSQRRNTGSCLHQPAGIRLTAGLSLGPHGCKMGELIFLQLGPQEKDLRGVICWTDDRKCVLFLLWSPPSPPPIFSPPLSLHRPPNSFLHRISLLLKIPLGQNRKARARDYRVPGRCQGGRRSEQPATWLAFSN